MFESNRKWAERDEGIGRFLTTELLKPPPFLRGSRSLVAKVPNTPRSIGDIFQVEWNIQAFVSFSLPFPPTLLSLSSIIPPYLFVSSRRYYCFFHTIYTFSYIRVRYFSSSFLPNTCTLDPRRENCSFEYADGFPLRRHTHSLSLSLSVSRGSIDKPSPPDSIIFSLFYFIFFFTSDPVIPLEGEAGKFQRNSHFPTFCRQEHFLGKRAAAPLLYGSLTHPTSASCRLCYTSLDSKTSLLESDDSSPLPSQSPPIPSRVEIHLREERIPRASWPWIFLIRDPRGKCFPLDPTLFISCV